MSNRAYLEKTKFTDIDDNEYWGWLFYDDYVQSYNNCYAKTDIPDNPFKFLEFVVQNCNEAEQELLDFIQENEHGMYINGNWYTHEEITIPITKAHNEYCNKWGIPNE